jgi:hypothetical protein
MSKLALAQAGAGILSWRLCLLRLLHPLLPFRSGLLQLLQKVGFLDLDAGQQALA